MRRSKLGAECEARCQQCPHQQGPDPTIPKPDEQSRFSCISESEESLKHQAKLKWWRVSQVKLRSQVSKCGSGPLTQPSSVPLQGSQAGLGWEGSSRFWNASQEVKFPGQDLDQQDTSPGTDTLILKLSQQPRTRAWPQVSQQRRGEATASHSSLSWGYAAVPYQHSSTGDRIQGGKRVPRTWGNEM